MKLRRMKSGWNEEKSKVDQFLDEEKGFELNRSQAWAGYSTCPD